MSSSFPRRRFTPILLLAALLGASFGAAQGQTKVAAAPAKVAAEDAEKLRLEVFDQVWETVNQKYYDPKFGGVDWAAMRAKYRPLVHHTNDEIHFYHVLNSMIEELHDKHTTLTSPQEQKMDDKGQEYTLGIELTEVEGVTAISNVRPQSEAARAGVKAGMRLQSVRGKPVAASTRPDKYFKGEAEIIMGEVGQPVKLGLIRTDGTLLKVSLHLVVEPVAPLTLKIEKKASGMVIIKFDKFRDVFKGQIAAALKSNSNAPALVLDLRDNTGGDLDVCLELLSHFFNDEILVGKQLTRNAEPGAAQVVDELKTGKKGGQLYSGPVVVLISYKSASAAELFTSTLQEQHRAHIIGTHSVGSLLGLMGHTDLKDGGQLRVSEVGFLTAKGRTIEGHGVTPDQTTPFKLADLQQGRDAALEAAKAYFARLPKQRATVAASR